MVNRADIKAVEIVEDLHEHWVPHKGQVEALSPVINSGFDTAFISCGRKWGKSEAAMYILWRTALLRPGAACYYIAPELTHGRELIWSNQRLQKFGPSKYVDRVLSNESRIIFKNGSFIKIVGSENWGAANGITPDAVVYDEFKAFHPQFHVEMNPNRLVRKAPLVIIGTPPHAGDRNYEQYLEYKEECEQSNEKTFIRQPSWENPHLDRKWLAKEKERLFRQGDEDVWYREYEAIIVPGGRSSVFPMFSREEHIVPARELVGLTKKRENRLDKVIAVDPATVSVFGGVVFAVDSESKRVYILDEIYEKSQANTSVSNIFPRIKSLALKWFSSATLEDDWFKVYDEREAWFSNEVMSRFGVYFAPSQKGLNKKEDGINLIRDLLTHNMIKISETCTSLINEIENMSISNGKIDERWTHVVDSLRYGLHYINYDMSEALERKITSKDTRRMYRIKDDIADLEDETDWTSRGDF